MVLKEEEIAATLLLKLYSKLKKIKHAHTPFENLQKGFPKHLRGEVKQVAKELIRKGLLSAGKHIYGLGVSINLNKISGIESIIEKYYPNFKEKALYQKEKDHRQNKTAH